MSGIKDITTLLASLSPELQDGQFVFCAVDSMKGIDHDDVVGLFKEKEAITVILRKEIADRLKLEYFYVSAWITLTVNSSLEAVGLTAAFSNALAKASISCNVIAGYHHDHIFIDFRQAEAAMKVLKSLQK